MSLRWQVPIRLFLLRQPIFCPGGNCCLLSLLFEQDTFIRRDAFGEKPTAGWIPSRGMMLHQKTRQ
ncbi:hypothetical protein CaCOL14_004930 [Colletotrichum acutatum]